MERIERGLVVMGCVADVRGYLPVLNEDIQKGSGAFLLLTE